MGDYPLPTRPKKRANQSIMAIRIGYKLNGNVDINE